jgi:hypothetical protein
MAETVQLFENAQSVLHRRLAGERVEVTDESSPAYRELVAAGLMMPLAAILTRYSRILNRVSSPECKMY